MGVAGINEGKDLLILGGCRNNTFFKDVFILDTSSNTLKLICEDTGVKCAG